RILPRRRGNLVGTHPEDRHVLAGRGGRGGRHQLRPRRRRQGCRYVGRWRRGGVRQGRLEHRLGLLRGGLLPQTIQILGDAGSRGRLGERRVGADGVVRVEPEQALTQPFRLVLATGGEGGIGRQQQELVAQGLVLLPVKRIGQLLVDLQIVFAR